MVNKYIELVQNVYGKPFINVIISGLDVFDMPGVYLL